MADKIQLASSPHPMCNSWAADTATVWFDIWDLQSGVSAYAIKDRTVWVDGAPCCIRCATVQPGVPLCQWCWAWGHPTQVCRRQSISCLKCGGPHREENHRSVANCCKGKPNAKPDPIPPTPTGTPCPHTSYCHNCDGAHAANNPKCPFWRHRFDPNWIKGCTARQEIIWVQA